MNFNVSWDIFLQNTGPSFNHVTASIAAHYVFYFRTSEVSL